MLGGVRVGGVDKSYIMMCPRELENWRKGHQSVVGEGGSPKHTSQKTEGSVKILSCTWQTLHQLTEKKLIKYYYMVHRVTQRYRESDLKATHPGGAQFKARTTVWNHPCTGNAHRPPPLTSRAEHLLSPQELWNSLWGAGAFDLVGIEAAPHLLPPGGPSESEPYIVCWVCWVDPEPSACVSATGKAGGHVSDFCLRDALPSSQVMAVLTLRHRLCYWFLRENYVPQKYDQFGIFLRKRKGSEFCQGASKIIHRKGHLGSCTLNVWPRMGRSLLCNNINSNKYQYWGSGRFRLWGKCDSGPHVVDEETGALGC